MAKRDFYEVLGVPRTASQEEIRKAYKKLARKYHPDVKPDDPDAQTKFAEITEANEVLSDEDKRRKYDQFGHGFAGGGGGGGGNPFEGFSGGAGFDLNDILGGMFGGGGFQRGAGGGRRSGPRPQKGQDVQTEITVPFQVAIEGGFHEISVQSGSKTDRLNVRIPAGIEDGKTIRLAGQGNPGAGGAPAGDLMVTVHVAPHPWFRREGKNLMIDVPLTPAEAALGAKVDVPTLTEGSVVLSVPAGSSSGAKLRLRGKGVLDQKSGERGDQLVVLKIVMPRQLSDEAKDLMERFAAAAPMSPRAALWT
ncbi:MAG: J domain-containing protein [Planctomyces sp.]|nr:J domain-containing protein [Planctomyces sp.]